MDPKKWEGCQWESKRILCTATVYEERVEGVAQAKHWEEREEAHYMGEKSHQSKPNKNIYGTIMISKIISTTMISMIISTIMISMIS